MHLSKSYEQIFVCIYIYASFSLSRVIQNVLSCSQSLDLLYNFHLCNSLTCTRIWKCFSCFIRRSCVLQQQKHSAMALLSRWGLITFWTTLTYMRVSWKVHVMTSYLLLMTFLTNKIQVLQHQWKKYVDCKGVYVQNKSHLVTFHENILVSLWTFQPTLIYIYIYIYICIVCVCCVTMYTITVYYYKCISTKWIKFKIFLLSQN